MAVTTVIDTSGLGDRAMYSQVMSNLRGAYEKYGPGEGGYPRADGMLTDRILNNVWAKNYLDSRLYVDGYGVTSVTTMDTRASSVRVPLMAPPSYNPRTVMLEQCAGTSIPGTPGNDGLENNNLPFVVQAMGIDVTFNQIYDQSFVVYKISENMVSLDILGKYNQDLPRAVANMTDSSIMAQQLNHACARASKTENANAVLVDLSSSATGYLQFKMNQIIGLMTNPQTDWSEGIVQYDLEGAIIFMRQKLWNQFFQVGNGGIINSQLGQEMLVRGAFTEDGRAKGNNIRGEFSGVYIKVVPDSYFKNAAAYLNLTAEQFAQFDKILGFIAHSDGTGFGRLDTSINPIQNPGNAIGTKVQNLWQWGVNVIRDSSIGIIAEEGFTSPITDALPLVAPTSFKDALGGYQTVKNDYGTSQRIAVVPADITTNVTLTVQGTGSASINDATLNVRLADGQVKGYSNNADGTYSFYVDRNGSATVVVSASGYQDGMVTISKDSTTGNAYSATVQLTATPAPTNEVSPTNAEAKAKTK